MSYSLRLDHIFTAELQQQGVTDVYVSLVRQGCAGTKVHITPLSSNILEGLIGSEIRNNIKCWTEEKNLSYLDGAQIARAKGKFFLVSPHIQTRCGCGSSFSFDKKTIKTDLAKIHRIRETLKQLKNKK